MALGISRGDEVITTAFSFVATANVIARLGARAVFVDIDPETFLIDVEKVGRAVSPKTKAIIPVHLFGQFADMRGVQQIANGRSIAVIEDAAQAFGASSAGTGLAQTSRGATLSFYPTKNLGGAGDGGMFVGNDEDLAVRIRTLRNHGQTAKYSSEFLGGNFRLDEIQAAVLRTKLPFVDRWNRARIANAATYRAAFDAAGLRERGLDYPRNVSSAVHVFHHFVLRTKRRDELQKFLGTRGIQSDVYYPRGLHEHACFSDWGYSAEAFPEASRAAREVLAIPVHAELLPAERDRVAESIIAFFR